MRFLVRKLANLWAARSMVVGALATAVDLACVVAAVELLCWPRVVAAMLGVGVGSTISFLLNKWFSFRDRDPRLVGQALRFIAATGSATLLHAGVVFLLSVRLGLHYVLSKLAADVVVFSIGNTLLMRFFVFPRAAKAIVAAMKGHEAEGVSAGGAAAP